MIIDNFFKKIRSKDGESSIFLIILIVGIIVFIVFPVTSFVLDRIKVNMVANEVRGAIDSAIIDSYSSLNNQFLSEEEFRQNNGIFQYSVTEALRMSLKLNNDMSPQTDSMLDGPLTIENLEFYDSSLLPYTDPLTGKIYDRPFIQINFTIRVKPTFYQDIILDSIGKDYIEFSSTRKMTLPKNN